MKKLFLIIIAILMVTGAFYGGMKYNQSKAIQGFNFQEFRNLSSEEQEQRIQQMGMSGTGLKSGRSGNQINPGFVTGEIILKDDQTITIKLLDGGSKIVFYSDSTKIGKFVSGTPDDLEIGKSFTINGKANQDGSITAQSIQLRLEALE